MASRPLTAHDRPQRHGISCLAAFGSSHPRAGHLIDDDAGHVARRELNMGRSPIPLSAYPSAPVHSSPQGLASTHWTDGPPDLRHRAMPPVQA